MNADISIGVVHHSNENRRTCNLGNLGAQLYVYACRGLWQIMNYAKGEQTDVGTSMVWWVYAGLAFWSRYKWIVFT